MRCTKCMWKKGIEIFLVLRIQKFSQMRPKISFRMKSEPTKTTINMLQQIPNFLDLESDSARHSFKWKVKLKSSHMNKIGCCCCSSNLFMMDVCWSVRYSFEWAVKLQTSQETPNITFNMKNLFQNFWITHIYCN